MACTRGSRGAHPLFIQQLDTLAVAQVAEVQHKNSRGYRKKNVTKRLAAIRQLAFEVIPQDPTRPEYRQGLTLGEDNKYWFRAKFFQQYRLFFRFHAPTKTIVYAWVNDQDTKRAYESSNDAYRVFGKMLAALLTASKDTTPSATRRCKPYRCTS